MLKPGSPRVVSIELMTPFLDKSCFHASIRSIKSVSYTHLDVYKRQVYGGHLVIKAYNKEAETVKTFKEANNVLYKSAWKSQFLSGLKMCIRDSNYTVSGRD